MGEESYKEQMNSAASCIGFWNVTCMYHNPSPPIWIHIHMAWERHLQAHVLATRCQAAMSAALYFLQSILQGRKAAPRSNIPNKCWSWMRKDAQEGSSDSWAFPTLLACSLAAWWRHWDVQSWKKRGQAEQAGGAESWLQRSEGNRRWEENPPVVPRTSKARGLPRED